MRRGVIALSGLAGLQLAAAACCRSNQCLRAIGALGDIGQADCLNLVVVTVTPDASTITETATAEATNYSTDVETATLSDVETTTATTETDLFTVSPTVTAFTQTDESTTTLSVIVTETAVDTVTATVTGVPFSSQAPVKARVVTEIGPLLPNYALGACQDWDQYVSACRCAGVTPTTIIAPAPVPTTVTETVSDTTTVPVSVTVSVTETDIVSATATVSATDTEVVSVTETVSSVATDLATGTTTATQTQTVTQTVAPQSTCKDPALVGAFQIAATVYPYGSSIELQATLTGALTWVGGSNMENAYVLDGDGYLMVAENFYPIIPTSYAYIYFVQGTSYAQMLATSTDNFNQAVSIGMPYHKIKGCVDPVTNDITLEADGWTVLIDCDNNSYVAESSNDMEQIQASSCAAIITTTVSQNFQI